MKTHILKLGTLLAISAGMLVSCDDKIKSLSEKIDCDGVDIVITKEGVESPKWLVEELENRSFSTPVGGKIYPDVYLVLYNEQKHVLLHEGFRSSITEGYRFFTCSGKLIEPCPFETTCLYWDLYNKDRTLLWKQLQ